MLSAALTDKLTKAEKMFLHHICNTATEKLGYESPLEYIKILQPRVVLQRLEEYKQTVKPKFVPILDRLQKKIAKDVF